MSQIAQSPNQGKEPISIQAETPNGGRGYRFFKRAFDLFAALLAGSVLLIPMLIIALAIRLDSKGPALYFQERLGKNGKPFTICKFRTMIPDAEQNGPQWAQNHDPRCTRVGAFLRRFHIDELPQLWNILKGDMSLVGPRPERAHFYQEFESYIHGFRHRLAVTPGVTGMAQIHGGYDLAPEKKILYDMEYIRTRSFAVDLKLILRTFKAVLAGDPSQ